MATNSRMSFLKAKGIVPAERGARRFVEEAGGEGREQVVRGASDDDDGGGSPSNGLDAAFDLPNVKLFRWNFFRVFVTHLLVCALVGGGVVKATSPNVPYIDCLFLAASSVTSSGLATISMLDLEPGAFPVVFVLMFLGCGLFVQLQVLIFRKIKYRGLRKELVQYMLDLRDHRIPNIHTEDLQMVIARKDMQDRAVAMVAVAILIHMTVFMVIASFILYGIDSTLYPPDKEVSDRGFSRVWNSVFLVMTSFTNCGITLASSNLVDYADKPGVYFFLCIMILAGNTSAPLLLRGIIRVMHSCASSLWLDKDGLRYALLHPRSISYMIFDHRQTFMLLLITFSINFVEYVFFLASTLPRPEAQEKLGGGATIAGLAMLFCRHAKNQARAQRVVIIVFASGFFQTISTRNAGLQILDLRILSRGMLVVYIISMYISSAPLVRTMYVSEQTEQADPAQNIQSNELLKSRLTRTKAVDVFMTFQKTYLFRHTAWIVIFFLVLAFSEDKNITNSPQEGLFDVFFEVFSAYGNVGISMGYPGVSYSLCGTFSSVGKLVVVLVMLMGKCRGLPTHSDVVIDFSFKTLRVALKTTQKKSGFVSPVLSPRISAMTSMDRPSVTPPRGSFRRTQAFRHSDERLASFSRVDSVAASVISRLSLDTRRPAALRMIFQPDVMEDQDSVHADNSQRDNSQRGPFVDEGNSDVRIVPPLRQFSSSLEALSEEQLDHEEDAAMLEAAQTAAVEISSMPRPPSPLLPALTEKRNGHHAAGPLPDEGADQESKDESFDV